MIILFYTALHRDGGAKMYDPLPSRFDRVNYISIYWTNNLFYFVRIKTIAWVSKKTQQQHYNTHKHLTNDLVIDNSEN